MNQFLLNSFYTDKFTSIVWWNETRNVTVKKSPQKKKKKKKEKGKICYSFFLLVPSSKLPDRKRLFFYNGLATRFGSSNNVLQVTHKIGTEADDVVSQHLSREKHITQDSA